MAARKIRSRKRCVAHLTFWAAISTTLLIATCCAFAGRWRTGLTGHTRAAIAQLGQRGLLSVAWTKTASDTPPEMTVAFPTPESLNISFSSTSGSREGNGFLSSSFSYDFVITGSIDYGLDALSVWRPDIGSEVVNFPVNPRVYTPFSSPRMPTVPSLHTRHISVPLWQPLALTAGMTALWGARLRGALRHKPGTCLNCGYDLRATPDRCPECGAVSA